MAAKAMRTHPQPCSTELVGGWEGLSIAVLHRALRDNDFEWLCSDGANVFLDCIGMDRKQFAERLLANAHYRRIAGRKEQKGPSYC
jgi:hypothetical protein